MRVLFLAVIAFSAVSCCIPCRQSAPTIGALESGLWRLVEYDSAPVEASVITLRFDASQKMVNGTAACNNFFAGYTLREGVERNVSFFNVGATRMYCPDSGLEDSFTAALPSVVQLKIDGEHLMLIDSLGSLCAVMRYEVVE